MDLKSSNSSLQSIFVHGGKTTLPYNKKMYRHLVIEIHHGHFLMLEMSVSEMLNRLRELTLGHDCSVNSTGSISYRDCKLIFSEFKQIPNIESRTGCIIVTMPPVVSIITINYIYVIAKEDLNLDDFLSRLCEITKTNSINVGENPTTEKLQMDNLLSDEKNFFLLALECCISVALEHLKQDVLDVQRDFEEVKSKLGLKIPYNIIMDSLHSLKHPIGNTQEKVGAFARIFCDIVNDSTELSRLELNQSNKSHSQSNLNTSNLPTGNRDVEILFEYFDQEIAQYVIDMRTLSLAVQDLENHINVKLSFARNELLRLDVMCNVICSGFAFGACISGIFGMNLRSSYENSNAMFWTITILILVMCIIPGVSLKLLKGNYI